MLSNLCAGDCWFACSACGALGRFEKYPRLSRRFCWLTDPKLLFSAYRRSQTLFDWLMLNCVLSWSLLLHHHDDGSTGGRFPNCLNYFHYLELFVLGIVPHPNLERKFGKCTRNSKLTPKCAREIPFRRCTPTIARESLKILLDNRLSFIGKVFQCFVALRERADGAIVTNASW